MYQHHESITDSKYFQINGAGIIAHNSSLLAEKSLFYSRKYQCTSVFPLNLHQAEVMLMHAC